MKLVVISHKPCWHSAESPSGYATDGGFAFQMDALSSLFDETTVCVPIVGDSARTGETPLAGRRMHVMPLVPPAGNGLSRKLLLPWWAARNLPRLARAVRTADAVHTPIPGDIGTVGILLAHLCRRRLFVRHCGNWSAPRSTAEKTWRAYMERFAGRQNVMMATGGGDTAPSTTNAEITWIFSSTLSEAELARLAKPRTVEPASPRLIIAARQEEAKGTGRAIDALKILLDSRPGATLTVVGDGPDLERFRRRASSAGLENAVKFLGQLDHAGVLDALSQADLFVFPTTASEGFPKAPLEAMANGLPVVATATSVLPHLLEEGGGLIAATPSPQDIAAAVDNAVSDPPEYEALSRNALLTASRHSLEAWAQAIRQRLEDCWEEPLRESTAAAT